MSTSLSWMPPPKEVKQHYIGLKYEIGKYFEEDYNGGTGSWTAGNELIPFLKGLQAATSYKEVKTDAQELIDAIGKYGEVVLTIS